MIIPLRTLKFGYIVANLDNSGTDDKKRRMAAEHFEL
jgi:hypothetical protein